MWKLKAGLTICRALWQLQQVVTVLCSTNRIWKYTFTRRDSDQDTNKPPAPGLPIYKHCLSSLSTPHSSHYPLPLQLKGVQSEMVFRLQYNAALTTVWRYDSCSAKYLFYNFWKIFQLKESNSIYDPISVQVQQSSVLWSGSGHTASIWRF